MGLRHSLEEHPKVAIGAAAGAVLIMVGVIAMQLLGGSTPTEAEAKAYFTTDLGETWFEDDATKLPPFDHEGRPAVGARLFKCGDDVFVGYLERYTPEGLETHARVHGEGADAASPLERSQVMAGFGRQVRAPGPQGKWLDIHRNAAEARALMDVRCPTTFEPAKPVYP